MVRCLDTDSAQRHSVARIKKTQGQTQQTQTGFNMFAESVHVMPLDALDDDALLDVESV